MNTKENNLMMYVNTTGNMSLSEPNDTTDAAIEYYDVPEFTKFTSSCILIGIIIFNVVVIILMFRKKKSRMGFFVTNLAIADLCVGLFYVFPVLLFDWFNVWWNEYFCYIYYAYFSYVAYYVSTYAIVVIAIDRMYVIVKPLAAGTKGKKYRYGLALSSWVLGLLLGIYAVMHVNYTVENGGSQCRHEFPDGWVVVYYDLSFLLIIPLIIIIFCYVAIIIVIYQRERYGVVVGKMDDHTTHPNKKVITSAKIRTIKLLLVVVIAYVVCWTPIIIAAFMFHSGSLNINYNQEDTNIYYALFVLAPLNSFANPLVFLVFNRKMFQRKDKQRKHPTGTLISTTESVSLEQ